MSGRRAPLLAGMLFLSLPMLGAQPMRPLPGRAEPYGLEAASVLTDWSRLDDLSAFAARVQLRAPTWDETARRLELAGTQTFGPLSAMDRYWLGSAWWATHQPSDHIRHPDWSPRTRIDPDLSLAHPEGGNCESSANGHAALLTALGVPTHAVYGYHLGAREGHVWTVSDVDGRLMFADVHLARSREPVWRPRPRDVMAVPSREAAEAFLAQRIPDNPAHTGLH